jgi:hypothetical protein
VPFKDPERQRRAQRESARRRRSAGRPGASNGSTRGQSVEPARGLLTPSDLLLRIVEELARLDEANLDPAIRARCVARLLSELAASRELEEDRERDALDGYATRYNLDVLSDRQLRQLRQLRRLLEAAERPQ